VIEDKGIMQDTALKGNMKWKIQPGALVQISLHAGTRKI